MPRKKIELTGEEIDLVLKVRSHMDVLLLKDLAWGTLGVVSRSMANELDTALRNLTPNLYPASHERVHTGGPLDKEFFQNLRKVLLELIGRKSPALSIADWRAKRFMSVVDGFIRYFKTAKERVRE